jgi:CRP-like cAMP-binding protein
MLLENQNLNGKSSLHKGQLQEPASLRIANGIVKPSSLARPRNRVLAALPPDVWTRVAPQIGHALLIQGRTLFEPGKPVDHVYFPNGGLISLVVDSCTGAKVEAGLVGREGIAGIFEALNDTPATQRAIVQVAGTACWLPTSVFRAEFRRGGEFQEWVLRYLQWMNQQASQCALCNRLHSVEERLARWLLMVRDRMVNDEISITHEAIAHLLGTRRSSVTVALGGFEEQGLLHCARGRLEILNASGLNNCACECYSALHTHGAFLYQNPLDS